MSSYEESTERLRQAMAALGEPQRFRLALLLRERPHSVGELVEATGLPQPLVSHHLSVLSRTGLAEAERSGRHAYYRLSDPQEEDLRVLISLIQPSGHRLEEPKYARMGSRDGEPGSRRSESGVRDGGRRAQGGDSDSRDPEPDRHAPRLGEIEDYLL